ncbi:MAG: M20/M25/M40 family metallo-hydrolase [Planctomycetota bacterium]|nr:M20/M25/M40 family metallo-hydrolase [Planctomycetota bacterium]
MKYLILIAILAGPGADDPTALLEQIIIIPGVSGHEERVREAIRERLPEWAAKVAVEDEHGNLIVEVGEGKPWVLFVAHMDETGLEVMKIADDGSLVVRHRGGFLPTLYEGEIVEVHAKEGVVPGVVPPRERGQGRFGYDSIRVVLGTRSAEETQGLGVAVGDTITVPKRFDPMLGGKKMGRGMDDRVGSAAILWAIRELDPEALSKKVTFVWSTEEEIGLEGAKGLAAVKKPDFVFAVDTYVSSDSPRESPRFGHVRLGEGAVVRAIDGSNIAPFNDVMRLLDLARDRKIPLEYGVTGGGNDGSAFVPGGAVDLPIAWPLRNSHTAVEIIHAGDLMALSRLVVAIAEEF